MPLGFADLLMIADNTISVDLEHARKVKRLIDALDERDDVEAIRRDIPATVIFRCSTGKPRNVVTPSCHAMASA